MKLSQNKQIFLVVVVFGLFAGGIYYDENYRKKKKLPETIQPILTPSPITFPLVAGFDYNQKINSDTTKYLKATFSGVEYSIQYKVNTSDGLLKIVYSYFGMFDENGNFQKKSVPLYEAVSEFERKYTYQSSSSMINELALKKGKLLVTQIEVKQKYQKGYIGSVEEQNDLLFVKSYMGMVYLISSDNNVLVTLYSPEMAGGRPNREWRISECMYKNVRDWINDMNQSIEIINKNTTEIFNNNQGI